MGSQGTDAVPDQVLAVHNPATGLVIDTLPLNGPEVVDIAVKHAHLALRDWQADEQGRRAALRLIGAAIRDATDELALLLSREQGKPVATARIEITRAATWFDHYASQPLTVEPDVRGAAVQVRRTAVGIVAAITPSNYPLLLAAWKLAPALLAGNAVLVKPSPATPLSTLRLATLLEPILPPGVLSVLVGDGELGHALVTHPAVGVVSFTGSPGVGWSIARDVPARTRLVLELGGNDPAIVLPDADIEAHAEALFRAAFLNNGQACIAIKRIYVPEQMAPALGEALAELARAAVVGEGTEPNVQFGPLVTGELRDKVASLVQDATRRGASVLCGGHALDRPGYFYAPTIVQNATDAMPLVADEQFGPALPLVSYPASAPSGLDNVIETINAGEYGLGASVWSADPERAQQVARRIDTGIRWVNCHGRQEAVFPFGGRRTSGLGVENGSWGLDTYSELTVDYVPRP